MKKTLTASIFLLLTLVTFSQIPSGYYDGTEGLTGNTLRLKLRDIITSGQQNNSYDALYDYYEQTDNYGNNKVWDMYSIHADGTANYWFYFNSGDECGSYSGEGDCYNREHSVPESWMGTGGSIADADLFVVIPTDGYVNNRRSSYPYGENNGEDFTSTNGCKLGNCTYPGYTGTVFEPIDEFKGDFARAYFYVVTRYNVSDWGGASFDGDGFSTWTLNMLLEWNDLDPVSQKEIDRNNAVYNIQHNRNPYIDHPEWVCEVFGSNCSGLRFTSQPVTSATVNSNYTYNITFEGDDGATLTISAPTLPSWLTLTQNDNNSATLSGRPTTSDEGDNNVVLSLTDGNTSITQPFTITVNPAGFTTLVDEDFASCPPAGWLLYSVTSDKNWECSDYGYMYINGYSGDATADDWLISPELNFSTIYNAELTFDTWTKYADDGITNPEVRLKYSTNYPGTGNPEDYTWTEISYNYPDEDSQSWTSSGTIDLSNITAESVYIAFQYTSSGTGANASAIWEVDNVKLTASVPENVVTLDNNKFLIFPNPATDEYINIKSTDYNNFSITLFDIAGHKIIENNIDNYNGEINITTLQSGIYILKITTDDNIFLQKIIIK